MISGDDRTGGFVCAQAAGGEKKTRRSASKELQQTAKLVRAFVVACDGDWRRGGGRRRLLQCNAVSCKVDRRKVRPVCRDAVHKIWGMKKRERNPRSTVYKQEGENINAIERRLGYGDLQQGQRKYNRKRRWCNKKKTKRSRRVDRRITRQERQDGAAHQPTCRKASIETKQDRTGRMDGGCGR